MWSFVFCLLLASLLPVAAAAQSGGQPGAFLQFGVGARALGMGGAFYAIADDATAAYWNPAGLAYLQRKEVTFFQTALFAETKYGYYGFAWPTATRGTFALGMTQLKSDGFEQVDATFDTAGNPLTITKGGSFSDSQQALALSWGKEATETISFGLSLKQVTRTLASSSDNHRTLDIAALKAIGSNYKLAIGMQNVFSMADGDTDDRLPVIVKVGNSMTMFKERLLIGFDFQKAQAADLNWRFGGEYWAARWFATRFGIMAAPQIQEADFGVGFRIARVLQLDISQGIHDLGSSLRTSLTFRFGRSREDRTDEQVKAIIEQGLEAFKEGNFQLATLRLNQALDAQPNNKKVKAMLERLQRVVGFVPQAIGGEEFQTYVRKGVISFVDGADLRGSVNALRYAYNMNPKDEAVLKLLNLVEKDGSEEITRRVEAPEMITFVDQKLYDARQAIYDGKYDLAIRRTQDVLDLEPSNVTALEIMGSAFFLMEEKGKARAVWKRVLEIDPKNKVVAQFIAQTE